jgi:dolichyl-phosphate-mannose-protein mannosyltransferase
MDVHPPLAKLLLTLAGWLAGFDGEFDFKDIGKDYLEPKVPYVAMRMLPAVCGILLVPTMFLTLKAIGCRTVTAFMGAGLIVFGKPTLTTKYGQLLTIHREWPSYSSTVDSPRFSPDDYDCFHRIGIYLFHKPTRARPLKGIPADMVVLACNDWSWIRRHRQC